MTFLTVAVGFLLFALLVVTFLFEDVWKRLRKLEGAIRELNPGLDL